jgi:hypothetical protein
LCAGNDLRDGTDILFSARLIVYARPHESLDERDHVDGVVGHIQLAHGKKDLLVLGEIKIVRGHQICQLVEAFGVDEDGAQ